MKQFGLALLLCSLLGGAQAASGISILNQTPIPTFTGYNGEPATVTGTLNTGSFGALAVNTAGTFYVTYLGQESGYVNRFNLNGAGSLLESNPLGTTISTSVSAGTLQFSFADNSGGGHTFTNGTAQTPVLGFAIVQGQTNHYGTFDYVLGFNDSYAGDADYDDFVVGVRFVPTAVPEPETYSLLLAGLGALGLVARRRRPR
jgi:PEP-CTERM motif